MGMGHRTALVTRAKELYAAGWRCGEIRQVLAREMGACPAEATIRRWVDPEYAEAQRESQRTGASAARKWGWKNRLARIHTLAEIGLEHGAIAKVVNHDFSLGLSTQAVRFLLEGRVDTGKVKSLLSPAPRPKVERARAA